MFFKPKIYKQLMDLYQQADHHFNRGELIEAGVLAADCARLYAGNEDKVKRWLVHEIFYGNLVLWQACSYAEQVKMQYIEATPEAVERAFAWFEQAVFLYMEEGLKDSAASFASTISHYLKMAGSFGVNASEASKQNWLKYSQICIKILKDYQQHNMLGELYILMSRIYVIHFAPEQASAEQEAINYASEAVAVYSNLNNIVDLLDAKIWLAQLHILPQSRQSKTHVNRALVLIEEANALFNDNRLAQNNEYVMELRAKTYIIRGEIYQHLLPGERSNNLHLAECSYLAAISMLDEQTLVTGFAGTVLDWVNLLLQNNTFYEHQQQAQRLLELIEEFIEALGQDPRISETHYKLIDTKNYVALYLNQSDSAHQSGVVVQLDEFSKQINPEQNPSMWCELQLRKITHEYEHTKDHKKACDEIADIITHRLPDRLVDAELVFKYEFMHSYFLAKCDYNIMAEAKFNGVFSDCLTGNIERFGAFNEGKLYSFPLSEYYLRLAPLVMAQSGFVGWAIIYFDIIYSRKLAELLEIQLIITQLSDEQKVHIKGLLAKLYGTITKSAVDGYQQVDHINVLDLTQSAFTELKSQYPRLTRENFFGSLEQLLPSIDIWQCIPLLGNDESRMLIIPPKACFADVIVTPDLGVTFNSEFELLVRASNDGLLQLQTHKDDQQFEQQIDQQLGLLAEHMHKVYGTWLEKALSQYGTVEHQVCMIATGPLVYFPFAMMRCTGHSFYQQVSFSYAQSPYALWSLLYRKNNCQLSDKPTLAFIKGSDDTHLAAIDAEYSFCENVFGQQYSKKFDSSDDFRQITKMLENADHWHFATHGNFDFRISDLSELEVGTFRLSASLLSNLHQFKTPKLVFLAACESGLQDFVKGSDDPEGYFESLFTIGALGAVGALWRQDDMSVALVSKYFYYYLFRCNSPAVALHKAQLDVSTKTASQLLNELLDTKDKELINIDSIEPIKRFLLQFADNDCPFAHPYFWAGFVFVGC